MDFLRTPKERFENLPDYSFQAHYLTISDGLRMHYLDEGDSAAQETVLLLHGEPSWSYLYRKMVSPLAEAGFRVIVPDLIGFGKSDKPTQMEDYTYTRHLQWVKDLIEGLDLQQITLFCQDWGGLIGLRLAIDMEERFARVIAANTGLPTGEQSMGEAFMNWRAFSQNANPFPVGPIINNATTTTLSAEVIAAYDAPFPDESYKAGARIFPSLVPISTDMPEAANNKEAWAKWRKWQKPFLTLFSDKDPITAGAERPFQMLIPGAKGHPHTTIENGGHFLQEDQGEVIATHMIKFIQTT